MADLPLDEQIVAALTTDATSETITAVLASAEARARTLAGDADAADVSSLSPLATSRQASEHRKRANDLRFEADRMDASISALRVRLDEIGRAEEDASREAERQAVFARRDALAQDIADEYPGIVVKLTDLAQRILQSDAECAPYRADSAEAIGRGLPANFYLHNAPVLRILDRAPPMPASDRAAWESTMSGWVFHGLDFD